MFVYKHTEQQNMLKSSLRFKKKYKLYGEKTQEFLGLKIQSFQGIVSV